MPTFVAPAARPARATRRRRCSALLAAAAVVLPAAAALATIAALGLGSQGVAPESDQRVAAPTARPTYPHTPWPVMATGIPPENLTWDGEPVLAVWTDTPSGRQLLLVTAAQVYYDEGPSGYELRVRPWFPGS